MSILCHKGIASLMLNLLWLIENWIRIALLDKNMISSGLSHGHKQPEKTLHKTRKSRKHYSLVHSRLLLVCQGCSEIWSI